MKKVFHLPFLVVITMEGKWYVAECPVLHIATQGKTEKEAKENMLDLIEEYIEDPDTPKDHLMKITTTTISYISVPVSKEIMYGKA